MKLNNNQKKYLKGLGHKLDAVVMVGKDGLNFNIINNLNMALKAHELVKVSMLKSSPLSVNEAAIELATESKSEVVSVVGRVIVLYKQSEKKLISLPK